MNSYQVRARLHLRLIAMIGMPLILFYGGTAMLEFLSPLALFEKSSWVLFGIIAITIWFEIQTSLIADLLVWLAEKFCARFIQDDNTWLLWFFIIERRK